MNTNDSHFPLGNYPDSKPHQVCHCYLLQHVSTIYGATSSKRPQVHSANRSFHRQRVCGREKQEDNHFDRSSVSFLSIASQVTELTLLRTELEIAKVEAAGPEDVDAAVQAAHKALKTPSWKLLPATDRGMLMTRLADLLEQNKEILATIDAWDNGRSCLVLQS